MVAGLTGATKDARLDGAERERLAGVIGVEICAERGLLPGRKDGAPCAKPTACDGANEEVDAEPNEGARIDEDAECPPAQ